MKKLARTLLMKLLAPVIREEMQKREKEIIEASFRANQHPHSNMKSHNHQVVSAKERYSPQEALKVRLRTLRDLLEEVQLFYQSDDMRSSAHNNLQVESSSMQNLYQFLSAQETALTYFLQMYTRFQSAQTRAFQDKL